MNEPHDERLFQVVVNHEAQYSIWPVEKTNPPGWISVGKQGSKAECLAHINEVWQDMRPLSIRQSQGDTGFRRPLSAEEEGRRSIE